MPLQCYRPFRTTPEVELLERKTIKIEDAAKELEAFLTKSSTLRIQAAAGSSISSSQVSAAQLPDILHSLQQHWVGRKGDARPAECFVEVRGRIEVHLHPFFLGNLARGLHDAVDQLLLQFNEALGCVPLAFLNVKPTGQLGALVAESPWVHFLADFRALGFAPRKGHRLLGTLAKVQTTKGINIQVLGFAHGLVDQRNVPTGFRFSVAGDEWLDAKGRRVSEMTNVVSFTLSSYHSGGSMRGGDQHRVLSLSGCDLQRLQLSPGGKVAKRSPHDWNQEGETDESDAAIETSRGAASSRRLADEKSVLGKKQKASSRGAAAAAASEGVAIKATRRHAVPDAGLVVAAEEEEAPLPKPKKQKMVAAAETNGVDVAAVGGGDATKKKKRATDVGMDSSFPASLASEETPKRKKDTSTGLVEDVFDQAAAERPPKKRKAHDAPEALADGVGRAKSKKKDK